MTKIVVSNSAFNEIIAALEKQDKKLGQNVTTITIEKGDYPVPENDLRMATIRADVAKIAASVWVGDTKNFVVFANEVFNFVLSGKVNDPNKPSTKW